MTCAFIMHDNEFNQIDNVRLGLVAIAELAANGTEAFKHDVNINREAFSELILNHAERLKNSLDALKYERHS
jgi:hypothetical protein